MFADNTAIYSWSREQAEESLQRWREEEWKSEYTSLNERETDIIVRMRLGEVVTVDEFK